MKMAKSLFVVVRALLLIFMLIVVIESRLVFRQAERPTTTESLDKNHSQQPAVSSVVSVPRVKCERGYNLVSNKCRKKTDSWFNLDNAK